MKILSTTYNLRKSKEGFLTNVITGRKILAGPEHEEGLDKIYRILRCSRLLADTKSEYIINVCKKYGYLGLQDQLQHSTTLRVPLETISDSTPVVTEEATPVVTIDTTEIKTGIQNLINFFSEFEFEPNFRFINTFARCANESSDRAKEYVKNYFRLVDNDNVSAIIEKIKSAEFQGIVQAFGNFKTEKKINNRFKLYFGSQGTGKTTQAMKESGGRCSVCHSAMLPSDLMEDFQFEDGKATFIPSALQNAMVNGEVIVLDEINLLPFESLRFLQSVLDGKSCFEYKGKTINIKDGFKIIGTMNLRVNGSTYALPEPLVDRCEDIREYKLTADNLIGAII